MYVRGFSQNCIYLLAETVIFGFAIDHAEDQADQKDPALQLKKLHLRDPYTTPAEIGVF